MVVFWVIIVLFVSLILFSHYAMKRKWNYWKQKCVSHLKPAFLFGNYTEYIILRKTIGLTTQDICRQFPNEPYIGTYYGTEPALIVQDPELIKLILVRDFYYFSGREITKYCPREPVTNSMFFNGGNTWKVLRTNLTPLFSASKMKNMFYLIQNCRNVFEEVLKKEISVTQCVEAKSLSTRFVMDTIASCCFGIDTEVMSMNIQSNPFAVMGEQIFATSKWRAFKLVARSIWPFVFYSLRFRLFDSKISQFFYNTIIRVFESRQYKQSSRNDFIDLIMPWKSSGYLVAKDINPEKETNELVKLEVNDDIIVGQCVLIFSGGFETSASTMFFALFELAKNREVQMKLISEIILYLAKTGGRIDYDCINDLPYLEACLNETMRLYPVLALITRETMADYTLPTGLQLEKGLRVHIPVYKMHRDPRYFPEPEQFRPERFVGSNRSSITPYTFLPFGEGPRKCLGTQFFKMQLHPAFLTTFKDYEVELADGMPTELELVPGALATQCYGGIYLKFIKRNEK